MARIKKRQGGYDTSTPVDLKPPKPGEGYVWNGWRWVKKPKKQRGYGKASEGRTGRSKGGRVGKSSGGVMPVAKPN